MKRFLIVVGFTFFSSWVHATVVFNNLGPGDTYNPNIGYAIGNVFAGQRPYELGAQFTPSQSGFLADIVIALGLVSGTNQVDVWLSSDSGGRPGSILESFSFVGAMAPFGNSGPPLRGVASSTTFLDSASRYWLIASASSSTDASVAWNFNSVGDIGVGGFRQDGDLWTVLNETSGAFRVEVASVSEPASLSLLVAGLLGVLASVRLGRRNSPLPRSVR